MEVKKVSFGFSKVTKKLNLLPIEETAKTETKVELIKCLEGKEIKLIEEKPEVQPLVIPLKESQKTSAALASLIKRRAVLLGEDEPGENTNDELEKRINANEGSEDIEKRAARELLEQVKHNDSTAPANSLVLPVVKPEDLPLDGAKESTLDDYESIRIEDFGKAMLRGMGWTEPPSKNDKKGNPPLNDTPTVRPKGMGLGADKALNKKPLLVAPEANEILEIKRNAYVRILGGKHKYLYGQIEGFDDHAGRIIVKLAIGGVKEAFNEFLCQPVSKKEYAQYGKCINTTKYEEYKKRENKDGQIVLNKDEKDIIDKNIKEEKRIKKEQNDSKEDVKYQKNNDDYKTKHKHEEYRDRDYIENDIDKESNRKDVKNKYDEKHQSKNDGERRSETSRDRRRESNRNEDRSRLYDRGHNREYHRDEEKDYRREILNRDSERYESKSAKSYDDYEDKQRYRDSRKNNRDALKFDERSSSRRDTRDCDRSANNSRHSQHERYKDKYKEVDLNDSSESENELPSTNDKKSMKTKHSKKKSKKSKKSKSKFKSDSSETEISSSSTDSSDDSANEKHKKHRKKSKKSKKQRDRSRSKGRK